MNKTINKYKSFAQNGYCIFENLISKDLVDYTNSDIEKKLKEEFAGETQVKKNPSIYHYNDSPRVIEAWKWSKYVREISLNNEIMEFLRVFYGKEPIPFSTINFIKASEQPLHSDYLHFGSIPDGYLVGVWVALEDINPNAGPLLVAAGSHADPIFSLDKLNLKIPTSLQELKANNTVYENYIQDRISLMNYEIVAPPLNKGSVLIWQANVYHGSKKIVDQNLTRKSQVTHYQFEGTKFYNPNYSLPILNKYAYRDLTKFDIRNPNNYS
jgi:ectoine hydroxylase-related dioxygenase (phytanoyl-CoA dioxygenase family)